MLRPKDFRDHQNAGVFIDPFTTAMSQDTNNSGKTETV